MRLRRTAFITALAILLLTALAAQAQTPDPNVQHFDKDGLAFDSPKGWTISDERPQDAQPLTCVATSPRSAGGSAASA